MLKNVKIRNKILALVIFQLILLSIVTIFAIKYQLNDYFRLTAESDAKDACVNIELEVQDLKDRALLGAKLIAEDKDVVAAVELKSHEATLQAVKSLMHNMAIESVSVTDEKGDIIARGHSSKYGDNIYNQYNVKMALEGREVTNIEEAVVVKLSVRAGVPIKNSEGKIIGTIITSFRLDEDAFVDAMKTKYGEDFTIFLGDERLITTIVDQSGKRIVGTKAADNVSQQVLIEKKDYNGSADVLGTPYYVHYKPIVNNEGEAIGMLFAGKSMAPIKDQEATIVNYIIIISSIMIILSIGFALLLSLNIQNAIKEIVAQTNKLVTAAVDGKLDTRAKPEEVSKEFQDIPIGVNKLLDAVIGPLNVAAEYVDRISKGDLPPRITDEYKGDFNEIKNNLNVLIDSNGNIIEVAKQLSLGNTSVELNKRSNQDDLIAALIEVIENNKHDAENIVKMSQGDLDFEVNVKSEHDEMAKSCQAMQDNLRALITDAKMLAESAASGKLDTRADASKHQGDFRVIVEGVNATLDNVIGPLNVAAEYVDRISKGDVPPRITDEYKGDFNEIKNNLNLCIDSIDALVNDANYLANEVMHAKLRSRVDASRHNGDFRKIIEGTNRTLDLITELLDNIDAPIMGIDNDYKVVFMNKLGAVLDSKKPEEIEGVQCFNHFKTSDCDTDNCACRQAMRNVKKSTSETDAHPGGMNLEIKYTGFPILDREGKVLGAFEIVIDQTEIKKTLATQEKIAEYQSRQTQSLVSTLKKYADGNLSEDITFEEPDADTFEANKVLLQISDAIDTFRGAVKSLGEDAKMLANAALEGKLDTRADADRHQGDFKEIIEGVNATLDNVIGPLNVAAEYVDRISKGDMPPLITDIYHGDFNEIKNNLNQMIHSLTNVTEIAVNISQGNLDNDIQARSTNDHLMIALERMNTSIKNVVDRAIYISDEVSQGHIDRRVDTTGFKGEYLNIVNGLNGLVDAFDSILNTSSNLMIADATGHITHLNKPVIELLTKSEFSIRQTFPDFAVSKLIGMNIDKFHRNPAHNRNVLNNMSREPHKAKLTLGDQKFELVITALFDVNNNKLGYVVQWFNTTSVTNFEIELRDTINELTNGNLSAVIDLSILEGSYKETSESINNMLTLITNPFREAGEVLSTMATGDLTPRIRTEYKGDLIKFKNDINTLGDSLSNLITELIETIETTASSAMEISSVAESLAAATQEQSSQADEVASAVEEMSRTVTENAMSANNTADMAQENGKIAEEGGSIVKQTVIKMRDIANVVETSASNIQKLGESSKEIGEIISVIDDIADQTNLLALNAAIEAARAGEQGRGFAVVADEVRKLAERTTDATKKIADMIKGIQNETEQAVKAMNKGTEEVRSGIEYADKAGESLNTILSSTQQVMDMINQIAAASEEQSATSEQISKNVLSISKVTSESAHRVEDVARTSEDLAKLTEQLRELMAQFKVDSNGSSSSKVISGGQKNLLKSNGENYF